MKPATFVFTRERVEAVRAAVAEERRRNGCGVYIVRAEGLGMVKIGYSRNVAVRIASLQMACPVRLVEVATRENAPMTYEQALHRRFAAYRTHGEWFREEGELADFIAAIKRDDATDPDIAKSLDVLP